MSYPLPPPSPRPGHALLQELRRRKVFRAAAVYGATVFAVLQVADLLVDPLALPDWTMRLLVLLAVVGLPVVVVLSWTFQVTPERSSAAEEGGSGSDAGPGARPARTPDVRILPARTLALVGALLVAGFGAGWFFGPEGGSPAGAAEARMAASLLTLRPNGVAVLPFATRSAGEADADFFAAGLHDDLLTRLAGVPGLVVISRTSVEQYRDTDKGIPQIGAELAVAYVLEGGVQQSGDRIRVNAQLIDARTDEHLWAETLDGDLSLADIFSIQSQLAARITEAMQTTLSEGGVGTTEIRETESLEAWEAVARAKRAQLRNERELQEAALEEAVAADPAYARAWAMLSATRSQIHWFGSDRTGPAREALDRALVLAPGSATTRWANAMYRYYVQMAYESALVDARVAVREEPGTADFHLTLGNLLRRVGDFEGAADAMLRAVELDPRNPTYVSALIETLTYLDDTEAADRWTRTLMDLPTVDGWTVHSAVYFILVGQGPETARRAAAMAPADLRQHPAVKVALQWADLLDATAPSPTSEEMRRALAATGWEREPGTGLYAEVSSMLVPNGADEPFLELVVNVTSRNIVAGGGAQASATDRSIRAHALAALGREDQARADMDAVLAWVRQTEDMNVGGQHLYNLALAAERLGRRDEAVELLRECALRWTFPRHVIRRDPAAGTLMQDPRARSIVERWTAPGTDGNTEP